MRKYLSLNEVIILHEYLIHEFGGSNGLRDRKSLEAALIRPQSGYYDNIFEEAAALIEWPLVVEMSGDKNEITLCATRA